MALPSLGSAVKGVVKAPVTIAKGVAKAASSAMQLNKLNISTVTSAVQQQTGIGDLADLYKASKTAKDDKKLDDISSETKRTADNTDALSTVGDKLDNISIQTAKTADNTDKLADATITTSLTLKEILTSINGVGKDINNISGKQTATPAEGGEKAKGGGIGGILGILGSFGAIAGGGLLDLAKTALSGFKSFGTLLGSLLPMLVNLGKFALRFAGPIGLLVTALLSIEKADWQKLFGNFSEVIDNFREGKWLEGIVRAFGSIGELIKAAVKGILATILDFFGFKEAAKKVREFFDSFDVKEIYMSIFNFIKDLPNKISKLVGDAANWLWETAKSAPEEIGKLGTKLKDWVVEKVSSLGDAIKEFFKSISPSNVLNMLTESIAETKVGQALGFKTRKQKEEEKAAKIERTITESALQNVDPTIPYAPELGITKQNQHSQLTREQQATEERGAFRSQLEAKRERREQLQRWGRGVLATSPIGMGLLNQVGEAGLPSLMTESAAKLGVTAENIRSGKVSIAPQSQTPVIVQGGSTINNYGGGSGGSSGGAIGSPGVSSPISTSRGTSMLQYNLYGTPGFVPSA